MNDYEYNQMLTILTGAGILSKETGVEKNTESSPDELMRIEKEHQAQIDEANSSARTSDSIIYSITTTNFKRR